MIDKIFDIESAEIFELESEEYVVAPGDGIEMSRRTFVQLLGAGILVTITGDVTLARSRGGRGRPLDAPGAGHAAQRPAGRDRTPQPGDG